LPEENIPGARRTALFGLLSAAEERKKSFTRFSPRQESRKFRGTVNLTTPNPCVALPRVQHII